MKTLHSLRALVAIPTAFTHSLLISAILMHTARHSFDGALSMRSETFQQPFKSDRFLLSLLWWDYSEGGSKYGSGCLNFDQGKKVVKMSREFLYKEIHVIFWRLFCVSQNSNNVPDILTPPQNSPTTAVLDMHNCSVLLHSRHPRFLANLFKLCSKRY